MFKIFNNALLKDKRRKLRNNMIYVEQRLWGSLRNRQLRGYKFRRQSSIGRYIVDFYCPGADLVVEVDGDTHYEPGAKAYDRGRQRYLEAVGLKVLSFTNQDIDYNMEGVIFVIDGYLP